MKFLLRVVAAFRALIKKPSFARLIAFRFGHCFKLTLKPLNLSFLFPRDLVLSLSLFLVKSSQAAQFRQRQQSECLVDSPLFSRSRVNRRNLRSIS